jgi:outer membrane protein
MLRFQQTTAILSVWLLLLPIAGAQDAASTPPDPASTTQAGRQQAHSLIYPEGNFARITRPYRAVEAPPISLANSGRLDSLIRAGNIYLSLQDAIALALENNIDIEIQRYGPQIADAGVLLAEAGGFARGVSTSALTGPSSASAGGVAQNGGGTAAQANNATPTAVGNTAITNSGPPIPALDPVLIGSARFGHQTTPQSTTFITNTNSLVQRSNTSGVGYQQSFLTGTTVALNLSNNNINTNSARANFNPATTSTLGLTVTQRLLQGWGPSLNSRQIIIAKNNREVADLTFKLQVITTVAAVMNLYWDLVSFNENVRVAKQALTTSEQLYNNNKKQVEVGTLAPIEVVSAEAQVATATQSLTIAETQVLQQETIIKSALSRTGVSSPSVAEAHIIPTDRMRMPDVEPVGPMQDLVGQALASRPELASNRIQLQNSKIALRGSKNSLLPTLDLVGTFGTEALAGQVNPNIPGNPASGYFVGGYGNVLTQLFQRNFPDYSIGFNLNIPIRNRAAQANVINDELTLRQQQLLLQRQENQVRVDVQNALIGVQQTRGQYQAATKARALQEQTLDAEQKKYALGASTIYNVILALTNLTQSQAQEVAALGAYSKARVELQRATGQLLNENNVSLAEAAKGVVARPPSPLPPEQK